MSDKMTPFGARFEIKVDGSVRTHRDVRETAIDAARFLRERGRGAEVKVTDLRDGSELLLLAGPA